MDPRDTRHIDSPFGIGMPWLFNGHVSGHTHIELALVRAGEALLIGAANLQIPPDP